MLRSHLAALETGLLQESLWLWFGAHLQKIQSSRGIRSEERERSTLDAKEVDQILI
jgi:hypothetical protein